MLEDVGGNLSKGLLEYDCMLRREEFNDNSLSFPIKNIIKNKFKNAINIIDIFINILLLILFIICNKYVLASILIGITLINLGYKIFKIFKDIKYFKKINNLNRVNVTVLREGVERIVKSNELVIGDIVKVKKGSIISADMRIIKSDGLIIDEKNLTGNKLNVEKYEGILDKDALSINDITNMAFRGTIVKEGEGTAVVVKTGIDTYLGKILNDIVKINKKNQLSSKVDSVINKIKIILIIINIILFMIMPGAGQAKNDMFLNNLFSIAIIIVPLISIIYSKIIKEKLIREGVEIKSISTSMDTCDINVVFLKELGSITKEEFVVRSIYCDEVYKDVKDIDRSDINIKRILDIIFINSSEYSNKTKKEKDSIDKAYIDFIDDMSLDKLKVRKDNKIKFKNEIDIDKKFITTVVKNERGYRANIIGTLEDILTRCTYILINGIEKPLTEEEIDKVKRADLYFSSRGLITEAIAYRSFNYEPTKSENVESNLVFVGLVALENLLNSDVIDDIANLHENGILPIVFSENNKIVAEAIGRKVGIVKSSSEVFTGVELSFLGEKEFLKCVSNARVFCRLTVEQKNKIISLFNNDKFKVAVEGESLSELPSLQESLVGLIKDNLSQLLQEINGNKIECSALKAILNLRRSGSKIDGFISRASLVYIQFLLGQIFAAYNYYFVDDGVLFSISSILLFNIVLIYPIILLEIDKKEELNRYQRGLIVVSYIIVAMMAIPLVEQFTEFVVFSILAINIFITSLSNCKFKFSFKNRNFIILMIQMILTILSIYLVYTLTKVVLTEVLIAIISIMVIIYGIMIFIAKKWQG